MKEKTTTVIALILICLVSGCGSVTVKIDDNPPTVLNGPEYSVDPLYAFKLDEYINALENHIDYNVATTKELSVGVQHEWENTDNFSFTLLDLNNDRVDELLILPSTDMEIPYGYDENYLYAFYTIVKGDGHNDLKTVSTVSFGPRDDGYYLYDNGIIKLKLGGSGIGKNIYYKLDELGNLVFIEEIDSLAMPDENNNFVLHWYKCTDGSVDITYWPTDDSEYGTNLFTEISESEANDVQDKYEKNNQVLERTRLSDYKENRYSNIE